MPSSCMRHLGKEGKHDPKRFPFFFLPGLTVHRMSSARVCHVSHLDLSIPRPEQMKFSMEEVKLIRDSVAECLGRCSCNLC